MTSNSGFQTMFNGSNPITDILTTVSSAIVLSNNMDGGGTYKGRYFCLGDLLIQFTDFSSYIGVASSTTGTYSIYYPTPYNVVPYNVMVVPIKVENQNFPVNLTIVDIYNDRFTFNISTHNGEIGFLVIGPRP
jgi:hypothetical protein